MPQLLKKYNVIAIETDKLDFTWMNDHVLEAIKAGWTPQGGISICIANHADGDGYKQLYSFAQAMVLYVEEELVTVHGPRI